MPFFPGSVHATGKYWFSHKIGIWLCIDKQIKLYPRHGHTFANILLSLTRSLERWIFAYSAIFRILPFFVVYLSIYHRFCDVDARVQRSHIFVINRTKLSIQYNSFFSVVAAVLSLYSIINAPIYIFFILDFRTRLKKYTVAIFLLLMLFTLTHTIHSFSTCKPILASLIDHFLVSNSIPYC